MQGTNEEDQFNCQGQEVDEVRQQTRWRIQASSLGTEGSNRIRQAVRQEEKII
tara:strand:+ start:84 stop:242 length:159 start_codon:yes stop_codon:yes gene_type:complete